MRQTVFLFFFPAAVVSALYDGFGPGVAAGLLGPMGTSYFFFELLGSSR